ncbi:MAG: hypothetical protein KF850_23755 [Labilithrix sp.]|nr:hypothetical protein [Labilithrix sp.]
MLLVSKTYAAGMPFWFARAPDGAVSESLVLRAGDLRQLRAVYWTLRGRPAPSVGVVVIHPRIDFTHHYTIPRLLDAGFAVLGACTRHGNDDTRAEHEEMLLDVAACVRHLKEERRIERVVLLGNCGGGSLVAYYQAEARLPPSERTRRSPGGTQTRFERATMPPADAMVYVAAHRGQGKVLLAAIDPSVVDEADPLSCDPSLDMYDEKNGFREPPEWSAYDDAFLARYRAGQRARVARLDATARALLARHDAAARAAEAPDFTGLSSAERRDVLRRRACEAVMVVYRTMANPASVDRRIDPSGRDYGSLLSERPDLLDYAALGLARTCTPRAWLSTWSGLSSRADLAANVARIAEPTLLVTPTRDREILPGDAAAIASAIASPDKRVVTLDARHYFEPEPGGTASDVDRLMDVVVPWIRERLGAAPPARDATPSTARPAPSSSPRHAPSSSPRHAPSSSPRHAPSSSPRHAPSSSPRHATTRAWAFPERREHAALGPGIERANLRELAARPERFEHHLVVCASVDGARLELATASEPLYFGHVNVSDEYVIALASGDDLVDGFPLRTYLSDPETGEDVGRYRHRAGDLTLHPEGWLHWPGRLRPPYAPLGFPPGTRRAGLSLVYCAGEPTPPKAFPLPLPDGRAGDVATYRVPAARMVLASLTGEPGPLATIGRTTLTLLARPGPIARARGAWLVVLEALRDSEHAAADLYRLAPGAALDGAGIVRALLLESSAASPDPTPPAWSGVPAPSFAPHEDAPAGALPFDAPGIRVEARGPDTVTIAVGAKTSEVPRYWLARTLFRLGLHGLRLGYVETYGGFFVDDRGDGPLRVGLRLGGTRASVLVRRDAAFALFEGLYRAVAPAGYTERLV